MFDLALKYVAAQLAKGPQASAWLQRDRPAKVRPDAVTRALRAMRDAGAAVKGEPHGHGFMWRLREEAPARGCRLPAPGRPLPGGFGAGVPLPPQATPPSPPSAHGAP